MIDLALSPEDEQKRNQTMQMQQAPLATPQTSQQQKGMGGQMIDMAKQRAMKGALDAGQKGITEGIASALAPSAGAANAAALAANPATMGMAGPSLGAAAGGAGAMTAIGTAMPYVGAGLLAGKALGLFNAGGQVGPLSAQYHAEGTGAMNTPEMQKLLEGLTYDELYKQEYGNASLQNFLNQHGIKSLDEVKGIKKFNQGGQVEMTTEQAMALMNNQPEPTPMPMARPFLTLPDELMMEQAFPTPRPQLQDPYGADRTHSPYDMLRPDNAPNT
jgi:hypothetical protein